MPVDINRLARMGIVSADAMQKVGAAAGQGAASAADQYSKTPSFLDRAASVYGSPVTDPRRLDMAMGMVGPASTKAIFRGTNSLSDIPRPSSSGFTWWTPNKEWAQNYGSRVVEGKIPDDVRLIKVKGQSAQDAHDAISDAGVNTKGLRPPFNGDEEYQLSPEEVHQYLLNTPGLSGRIKDAGFHGVEHDDIREGQGIEKAIAFIHPKIGLR
jgi:hypothetical protein